LEPTLKCNNWSLFSPDFTCDEELNFVFDWNPISTTTSG